VERLDRPVLASIGTTHPWNVAGVGLDAHVAEEYGLAHASAIVAVSAQDANGLRALQTLEADVVAAQLDGLPPGIAAYRIGALVSSENVRIVAAYLRGRGHDIPIVVDPVLSATLGGALQTDAALPQTLRDELLPLGVLVTPNLREAQVLLGMAVTDEASMAAAGRRFVELGALAAMMTGGHLAGDPVDIVVAAARTERLSGPRLPGSMRGSGCTLAAALACELSRGGDLFGAAARSHAYVREKIAAGTVRGGLQVAF
jgi:hydroxymethylpyrimidine/phosphomethylpyrimidine kinase